SDPCSSLWRLPDMSVFDTTPGEFVMGTAEVLPIGIDVSALLQTGESVSSPSVTATDVGTGLPVTLADAPAVSGTVVTQILRGSEFTAGHAYRIGLVFNAAPSVTVWQCGFDLTVA
ncbi:MAG: hypothetical protein ACP5QO_15780, partial [Clostridia bacterium]